MRKWKYLHIDMHKMDQPKWGDPGCDLQSHSDKVRLSGFRWSLRVPFAAPLRARWCRIQPDPVQGLVLSWGRQRISQVLLVGPTLQPPLGGGGSGSVDFFVLLEGYHIPAALLQHFCCNVTTSHYVSTAPSLQFKTFGAVFLLCLQTDVPDVKCLGDRDSTVTAGLGQT